MEAVSTRIGRPFFNSSTFPKFFLDLFEMMDVADVRGLGRKINKINKTDRTGNAQIKRMLWLKIALNESRRGYRGGRGSGVI